MKKITLALVFLAAFVPSVALAKNDDSPPPVTDGWTVISLADGALD